MNRNKHLTHSERIIIEQRLLTKESFKSIANELGKDPTTIAKEIRNHIQFRKVGCYGRYFNDCRIRKDCTVRYLCGNRKGNRLCGFCNAHPCSSLCKDYRQEKCLSLWKNRSTQPSCAKGI